MLPYHANIGNEAESYLRGVMALLHSFESDGNFLFRYRGQIPVILFLAAIPVVYFTDTAWMSLDLKCWLTVVCIAVSVIGFAIRGYAIGTTPKGTSGRNREEQVAEQLNTAGIYSAVRHPLYLGNYLMWIGIVGYTLNAWFVIIVSLAFWLYYERIMFAEERFLERKFGETYLAWSKTVPAFIPAFGRMTKPAVPFSFKALLRREYSGVLATVIGFVFIDFLRRYFEYDDLSVSKAWLIALGVALLLTIVLRTLKKMKKLDEPGRS
jgi:protein-S-isoprenylcysteine O-methyltransferase Ste14